MPQPLSQAPGRSPQDYPGKGGGRWHRGGFSFNHPRLYPLRSKAANFASLADVTAVARVPEITFDGVLLLRRLVTMFDFEPPIIGSTEVAFAWFWEGGFDEASRPSTVVHTFST